MRRAGLVVVVAVLCACGGGIATGVASRDGSVDGASDGGDDLDGGGHPGDAGPNAPDGATDALSQIDGPVVVIPLDGACGPSTCPNGCCAQRGQQDQVVCIAQPDELNCGSGGGLCSACFSPFRCTNGSCTYAQPSCSEANCHPGCCVDENTCSNGQSQTECGLTGSTCVACPSGDVCQPDLLGDGGSCGPPTPPTCGPGLCAGCCLGVLEGMVCAVGNQNIACGTGGGACASCGGNLTCKMISSGFWRCSP
jgi:hypothetical protein